MKRNTKITVLATGFYVLTLVGNILIGGIGVVLGRQGVWVDSTMGPLLALLFFYQAALFIGTFALGLALGTEWWT